MEPKPTRNVAALVLDSAISLSSMLKTDILREPNTQKRMLKVKAVSAAKGESSFDGVAVMETRFWPEESSKSPTTYEFLVPSWWTPAQFLGALFMQTKDSKCCWVIHCNFVDMGLRVPCPHVSMSGINGALGWSPDEMDHNLRHNGGLSAVRSGRESQTRQSTACTCRVQKIVSLHGLAWHCDDSNELIQQCRLIIVICSFAPRVHKQRCTSILH